MADNETKPVNMVAVMTEYPPRLQMSMLAPVKALAASIAEGDKEVRVCGYVFGEARGVSHRNNPNSADGESSVALTGIFEGIPQFEDFTYDGKTYKCAEAARLASGVCFLPPQSQAVVVETVLSKDDTARPANIKRGQRIDKLGVVVPISFEIGIRKSGSPVGYEWVARGLANVAAVSPLERMREALKIGGGTLAQAITDGTLQRITEKQDAPGEGERARIAGPAKTGKSKKR